VSIAITSASIRSAARSWFPAIAGDQIHDETGDGAAQRDSSDYGQECESDAAFGASADDKADATGDSERGQRFFFYIFADVAIAPTTPLDVRDGGG
jgi:hypothetical protein